MSINISKVSAVKTQGLISECHQRLNRIGKMTLDNVSKADKSTRRFLSENSPCRLKELAQINCFAANKIKTEFDKKYGEGNYVLIAVGRSISSIAETLGQIGMDTKIIPLSGLRRNDVDNINKDSLITYKTFLAQKGLSKSDLKKNKDKTYILMDYAHHGCSLDRAEKLLKKEEMLGCAENLVAMSINNVLGNAYINRRLNTLMEFSRFKDYSYVGKLHISQLQNVYNQCSPDRVAAYQGNITKLLRKLFWFNVFDSLLQNNYIHTVPNEEFKAIYKHYLSPQAVKNYLNNEYKKQNKIADGAKNNKI